MKINWGTGIAIFYITFAAILIFAVIKSTQYDNSLVSADYYADDLKYQEHYVKLTNSAALAQDLKIVTEAETILFQFPSEVGDVKGNILFFCPSDSKQDFTIAVLPNATKQQTVKTQNLKRGLWKVKVDWQAGEKAYYKEETIIL